MQLKMTTDEALAAADEMTRGATLHEDSIGRAAVLIVLAEEVRKQRRGELICQKCGLRKDGEVGPVEF